MRRVDAWIAEDRRDMEKALAARDDRIGQLEAELDEMRAKLALLREAVAALDS